MSTKIHFTPWGSPQTQKEYAPGLVLVTTASHGGFFVSDEMLAKMPVDCREARTYAGKNWYEEDCDYATVVLAFPEFFSETDYYFAVQSVQHTGYLKHLATPERKARADKWLSANGDKWASGGGMTDGNGWVECAYKLADRSQRKNKWFPGVVVLPAVFTIEQFENAPLYSNL
jgi:hypothetical protein